MTWSPGAALPGPHARLLQRARAVHLGDLPDDWSGLADEVRAAAEHMAALARRHGA